MNAPIIKRRVMNRQQKPLIRDWLAFYRANTITNNTGYRPDKRLAAYLSFLKDSPRARMLAVGAGARATRARERKDAALKYDQWTDDWIPYLAKDLAAVDEKAFNAAWEYSKTDDTGMFNTLLRESVNLRPDQVGAIAKKAAKARELGYADDRVARMIDRWILQGENYRAGMIAQTELSRGYSIAYEQEIQDEMDQGLLGPVVPVWSTAQDELVCDVCGALDGKQQSFGNLPPAHPWCRCAIIYELELERAA